MKIYLDSNKKFYKANMHCHTTNSDGKATPEKIKEEYMKRGYSIVAYTDHEHIVNNSHLIDDNFIAITGFEMNLGEKSIPWDATTRQFIRTTHINLYATTPDNDVSICTSAECDRWGSEELRAKIKYDGLQSMRDHTPDAVSKIISYAHEKGFLVCYNHPVWSLDYEGDYLNYEGVDFVEIFNTGCDRVGLYAYDQMFDVMLKHGKDVGCIAADDNHNGKGFESYDCDSFGGWIMVNTEKLTYESVIDALRKHEFYASCGPEIYSLTREGNKIFVKTSTVRKISKQTEGRQSSAVNAAPGTTVTEAVFTVRENEKIFRITIEDERGYKAYSNAYNAQD